MNESTKCDKTKFVRVETCRILGEPLQPVVDLGNLYVSSFLRSPDRDAMRAPLQLGLGSRSGFLQLMHTVDRGALFEKYWYQSGTNATMPRQLRDVVNTVARWTDLADGDVVLDIGCNDGTLLGLYPQEWSLVRVGIDPARNMAEKAKAICDVHAAEFFTKDAFLNLTAGRKAKVITSIAMFYSLEYPHQFVSDVVNCLQDDGLWIVQMSYTPLMLAQNAFDNICHEHTGYYTLQSMDCLVRQHGLQIVDVELNEVNGGSFRLVIAKNGQMEDYFSTLCTSVGQARYDSLLAYERMGHYDQPEIYTDFMNRVARLKDQTHDLLRKLRQSGKKVCGYGASTKGNTLLQYYDIGPDLLPAIAERQPAKWGLLTAGSWIPIISEDEMRAEKPDYLFILPWHFAKEFLDRERELRRQGCRFIFPLPQLRII
jgi:NDP-4-keto-2,6-dideoxyhexose 3-C-methyltransferase